MSLTRSDLCLSSDNRASTVLGQAYQYPRAVPRTRTLLQGVHGSAGVFWLILNYQRMGLWCTSAFIAFQASMLYDDIA